MYKCVAIDVDGTLVNDDKKLTQRTIDSIKMAIQKDIKIVVSSARSFYRLKDYLEQLQLIKNNQYTICFNGAIIIENKNEEVMLSNNFDTEEIFLETLDEINTVARTAKQELEEKFLATVACKAAVKAHMALTKEEVDSLMDALLKLPNPFTCPHGRPTVIKMSKTDIEKKFSRR